MDVTGIASGASAVKGASYGATAAIKVMKMAEDVSEDVMNELLDSMNSMISGLGGSIDMSV